jgi:hypothetical protein
MSKLFQQPSTLKVNEDMQHWPNSFIHRGRKENVEQILKRWRVNQWWWKVGIEREYFEVITDTGMICELYRDVVTGRWYLQRIYD